MHYEEWEEVEIVENYLKFPELDHFISIPEVSTAQPSNPIEVSTARWECIACTHFNNPELQECDICHSDRPHDDPSSQPEVAEEPIQTPSSDISPQVDHSNLPRRPRMDPLE